MSLRKWASRLMLAAVLGVGAEAVLHAQETKKEAVLATLAPVGKVEGISEFKLSNGLRVLLVPDNSKPTVTVNLTLMVGSRHEGYGETGMAHLLEHMLFKGTPNFPNVPKALAEHGADFNGTTWLDRTNYYETMPATDANLEFGIQLEADRLVNSFVKREDLISEMTVVRNEFEAGENDPQSILSQRMNAVAFEWHNYGKSTIGNRSDIERVPIDNLQAFYRKYYQVDNATLIVAGKFDEKKALDLITKYFGPLKAPKRVLTNTYTEEPAQDGERSVTLRRVGSVGAAGVCYHVPAGANTDYAALEMLEDVLSRESGRLEKALVQTKLATSVSGTINALHDPGLMEFLCKTEPGKVEACKDKLLEVIENLEKEPVTADELALSKKRFTKQYDQITSNTSAFATQLSEWIGAGDYRLFFLHRDRVEKVTVDDVNRVAKKYLSRNNRTVGTFLPTKGAERASIPPTPDLKELLKDYKGRQELAQGEVFDPTPENVEKRVQRGAIGSVKTAMLSKKTKGETVDLKLNLRFGNEESLKGLNTAADLLGQMLMRGTKTRDREKLKADLDKLGSTISVSSTAGLLSVSLDSKKPNFPAALEILQDVLRNPAFDEKEFELLKAKNKERLTAGKTDPQALAGIELARRLSPYPQDNIRYQPTIDERIANLEAVTLAQVKELYAKQLGANVGELAVVGDFDPATTTEALKKALADWSSTVPHKRIDRPAVEGIKGGTEKINTPDKENAIYMAALAFPMNDADPRYAVLEMGNYLLGGAPLASRLSNRVRGEEGLSYGVGSMVEASAKDPAGRILLYAITNPLNVDKVDRALGEEVAKFLKDGVSLDELERGKTGYLQTLKTQHVEDSALANDLASCLSNGRTFQYYADLEKRVGEVKAEDIQKVFKELLDPKKLVIIEAGDFSKKK